MYNYHVKNAAPMPPVNPFAPVDKFNVEKTGKKVFKNTEGLLHLSRRLLRKLRRP